MDCSELDSKSTLQLCVLTNWGSGQVEHMKGVFTSCLSFPTCTLESGSIRTDTSVLPGAFMYLVSLNVDSMVPHTVALLRLCQLSQSLRFHFRSELQTPLMFLLRTTPMTQRTTTLDRKLQVPMPAKSY